ncbi:TetR/AcrR family transcriptional regulator [Natronoglycomyces albus]|uniref:TetR/AcrR family transcriptional regulator n=1 Tax=Natronoglycomyces albus TaxID=2811108 RepID=A0A895XIZ5_9ACTN|nr:TetR/AcrR family transcriptional regulator [Natronoglycomyces albus]QSB04937.1 TetR/AcrR family transcriptional regulator [Natronoglycomyces albus]
MTVSSRTQPDKAERILIAALEVFAQQGFDNGKIEEIAHRAGVAKPTIYNRFGDKRTLFTEAVNRGIRRSGARVLAAIDSFDLEPSNLRAELEHVGRQLVGCFAHEEGSKVMRLQMTEGHRFPELVDGSTNHSRNVDALAGKLAQLATTGYLRLSNPQRAARQLIALVTSDAPVLSGFGRRVLSDEELDDPVKDAVDTFLAAFGVPAEAQRPTTSLPATTAPSSA